MKTFINDILTEHRRDDKYSSKKIMGIISGLLVCIAFIGDGFHWFVVNENLFNSMLIFSATMLGASTIPKVTQSFSKSEESLKN